MASYIRRRKFLAALGGAVGAWPLAARGQLLKTCVTDGRMPVKSLRGLILPVALSLAAIGLTTLVLLEVYSPSTDLDDWRDPEDLALAYLLPPIFIAVFFGSSAAVMSHSQVRSPLPTLFTRPNLAF